MSRLLLPCLLAITGATLPPLAHAAPPTSINFSGNVIGSTCTIAVNGALAPAVATVTLPTVGAQQLAAAGRTAGRTPFDIQLTQCTASGRSAMATFNCDASISPNGHLKNTGSAGNVDLQLLDRSSGLPVNACAPQPESTWIPIVSGQATLPFAVEYYAVDAATVGTVRSSATFNVFYN